MQNVFCLGHWAQALLSDPMYSTHLAVSSPQPPPYPGTGFWSHPEQDSWPGLVNGLEAGRHNRVDSASMAPDMICSHPQKRN